MIIFKFKLTFVTTILVLVLVTVLSTPAQATSDKEITLCWADWEPAKALVELTKDFTAETGIKINFELTPWTNYSSRILNELNSGGKMCDLVLGDSQWIGGSATYGHYVKLNEYLDKESISMNDFLPALVEGYATWPKGTKNYYSMPAMSDALGWVYRKDWFARPEIRQEFQATYNRELTPPKTWEELLQVAEFFQDREIDGKTVYGAAIYTERGSEGITMGATAALYAHAFEYQNPKKNYDIEGYVNSKNAVKGLKIYKDLYDCCTPPGHSNAYMIANLDAYKSGQVAIQMNWFAFFPDISKDPSVGGDKSSFFVNPGQLTQGSPLGGQGISVVSYSDHKKEALSYIKWFANKDIQAKWWSLGGYSGHKAVVLAPGFADSAPFAADFLIAMDNVRDFWQDPNYAELLKAMQKRLHDYVIAGKGTSQQALDKLAKDWIEIFEDDL